MLKDSLHGIKIVLASKSPRRQILLQELGIQFEIRYNDVEVDETFPEVLEVSGIPEFLSRKKAIPMVAKLNENEVLLTSDTIVVLNSQVIGKPKDRAMAFQILSQLSGHKHTVITGVTLATKASMHSFNVCTDVYFRTLTEEEIYFYIDNFHPYDKAGAYGIQEWIGLVGVERIDGSYYNVMGLPVQRLYTELIQFIQRLSKLQ